MLAPREYTSIALRYEIRSVRTIEEIRQARLLQLLEQPDFPTVQALATKLGKSHAQVSQWKNRSKRTGGGESNIDSASARMIETVVGKPIGWMDNDPAFDEIAERRANQMDPVSVRPGREPGSPPPIPDFRARTVSESQWDLLQQIDILPEREQLVEDIKRRAAAAEAYLNRMRPVAKTDGSK